MKYLIRILFLFSVLVSFKLFSHQDGEVVGYSPELAHAPTPLPDRVVLTWEDDPATTQSVTWRTDTATNKGMAHLAIANANVPLLGKFTHSISLLALCLILSIAVSLLNGAVRGGAGRSST